MNAFDKHVTATVHVVRVSVKCTKDEWPAVAASLLAEGYDVLHRHCSPDGSSWAVAEKIHNGHA